MQKNQGVNGPTAALAIQDIHIQCWTFIQVLFYLLFTIYSPICPNQVSNLKTYTNIAMKYLGMGSRLILPTIHLNRQEGRNNKYNYYLVFLVSFLSDHPGWQASCFTYIIGSISCDSVVGQTIIHYQSLYHHYCINTFMFRQKDIWKQYIFVFIHNRKCINILCLRSHGLCEGYIEWWERKRSKCI